MKKLFAIAAAQAILFSASTAFASSFTGNWLLTVTRSASFNGAHCLTLTDSHSGPGIPPHGGTAKVVDFNNGTLTGEFTIVNNTLIVGIAEPGSEGEAGQPYIVSAPATLNNFRSGSYENYLGSEPIDSGAVAFRKGGC